MGELVAKTGEALGGLWLAFSAKEKVVVIYAGLFVCLLVAGTRAEAKRKREQRELVEEIVARLRV